MTASDVIFGVIGVALLADCARTAYKDPGRLKLYLLIRPRHVVIAAVNLALLVSTAAILTNVPGLSWSWLSLFGQKGTNLNVAALTIPYVWPLIIAVLMFVIPTMATIEERIFRSRTRTWRGGILRSLAFGLMHCIVGVPIAAGLALTIAGLTYTAAYFWRGLGEAIVLHITSNTIVVFCVAYIIMIR